MARFGEGYRSFGNLGLKCQRQAKGARLEAGIEVGIEAGIEADSALVLILLPVL